MLAAIALLCLRPSAEVRFDWLSAVRRETSTAETIRLNGRLSANVSDALKPRPFGGRSEAMTDFERESRLFQQEIEEEAARLVRLGVPPWDALIQARARVRQDRQAARRGREDHSQ